MAAFSLEITSKTLPQFTGNYNELECFMITGDLIYKTLSDAGKQDFLQYVYHAKLTPNVKTAIGGIAVPDSFEDLKNLLQQRYKSNKTIPQLQDRLNNLYQGRMTVSIYREKILEIIDNLNKLGIEELGNNTTEPERNVIITLNNKLALDSFKRGINEDMKTAIFAARPKTLQDAVELALELENERKLTQNSVMHFKQNNRQKNFNNNKQNEKFHRQRPNNYGQFNNTKFINGNFNNNTYPNRNNNNEYNNRNNNPRRMNNYNRFNKTNNNNLNRVNNYRDRRNIHTIHNTGNFRGSEYEDIPDSQN